MLRMLLIAWLLLALTVLIHAIGLAAMGRRMLTRSTQPPTGFWPLTAMIVRIAWQLILLHAVEMSVWALFYWWQGCLPDLESSLYFSGVTYATVGYGDMVLPLEWRLLGPIEGLAGILMCGLSVSFFFVVVSKAFRLNTTEAVKSNERII